MLKHLAEKKKIIVFITIVVLCVAIGVMIFSCSKSDSVSKEEDGQIEKQENDTKKEQQNSESEEPYSGNGLQATDEKQDDVVDSIQWPDSENSDKEEADNREDKPSIQPGQDAGQVPEQSTKDEGELDEDVLDDGKTWGNNIS